MSNYATLKSAIQSAVYTNGNGEITGAGLQAVLLQIVNTVGDGYVFKGVATAGTAAGSPDANVFYIAPAGTYTNFGSSYTVLRGNLGVFTYNGSWSHTQILIGGGGDVASSSRPITDNATLNSFLTDGVVTTDVEKLKVTIADFAINIYLLDENDVTLRSKYFNLSTMTGTEAEIVSTTSYTLTNGLFIISKQAIRDYIDTHVLPGGYVEFVGNLNACAYDYNAAYLSFGQERSRDWGTGSVDISQGTSISTNIYNTVDCFRFPSVITSITIPSGSDGVVEVYRCRVDDVQGTDTAELLATFNVKAGKFEYPCDIYMNAGDGIGFACSKGNMMKYYDSGWRLASYDISTLLRGSAPSGFADAAMMASVKYRYFAQREIKPLAGMKISVLGDSISTFGATYSYSNPYYPSGNVYNYLRTWWGRLVQDGAIILKNQSVSQSTIVSRTGADEHRWIGYESRISALSSGAVNPDVIFVLAGINDMNYTSAIGDFDFTKDTTDYTTLDTTVFATAYQYVVMRLLELYPASKIYICTPFKDGYNWGFPEKNGSRYLYQINDAIRTLAHTLGVGFIDFFAETKISYQQMADGVYGDTVHPNMQGHYEYYKIAKKHLLDYYIGDNYEAEH